jgi:FkbM family methyltransferase
MTEWFHRLARRTKAAISTNKAPGTTTPIKDMVAGILGNYSTAVVNVGARWGDAGAWWRIEPVASSIGFDPDPLECDRLNELCASPRRERYIPLALGAEQKDTPLYITLEPACSSVYPPLEALSERFPELEVIQVAKEETVRLVPLDNWWESEERPSVSFLKIDTQGSEFDILQGAKSVLANCLGCEIEVEFSPIYKGQPLFSDVDTFLRAQGFVLWRLNDLCHYSEKPRNNGEKGRLYWANAVYLRDYRALGHTESDGYKGLILSTLLEALGDYAAAHSCLTQSLAHWSASPAHPALNRLTLSGTTA